MFSRGQYGKRLRCYGDRWCWQQTQQSWTQTPNTLVCLMLVASTDIFLPLNQLTVLCGAGTAPPCPYHYHINEGGSPPFHDLEGHTVCGSHWVSLYDAKDKMNIVIVVYLQWQNNLKYSNDSFPFHHSWDVWSCIPLLHVLVFFLWLLWTVLLSDIFPLNTYNLNYVILEVYSFIKTWQT